MKTNENNLFKKAFLVALSITIIGAIMKITHMDGAQILLILGVLSTLGYVVIGIYEVNISKRINQSEKIMWTIGFIFINFFAGLLYLINGRKRIV
ncbi:hypothetical protein FLJC2902T_32240 [Flavobacterium limnosediminis JC2902]|uniref:Cardiolipin synthase N-terminal domain-containing protein n=1 Tax=Flavobacterium limnosediminis JC2902 TaxID=1341181 RepID=V6SBS5_9FLAO|nr:hypothetical protein [Flavobacterium limnosediminis]ESU23662.1 hypothetical protein FLJC2902T_32240 [Flavobacterium limnosediminis JC2902]